MKLTTNQIGWTFVAGQAILLVLLMVLPGASDWPSPFPLYLLGRILFFGGLLLIVVASLRLGTSLTPTPVPTSGGQLKTGGLYSLVRHPIYTGVLAVVLGIIIRSRSILVLIVGTATIGFFYVKSNWEEGQLRRRYPDYGIYASTTPRFIPRLGRKRS